MNMNKKIAGFILFGVLLLGAFAVAQKPGSPIAGEKTFIEVHGPNIAFVPMSEIYVTYDGKVRKIVKFTETIEDGKADCRCPRCCDGNCYVIIYTNLILPGGGSLRAPFILWIEC